jgi:hypothetical protein
MPDLPLTMLLRVCRVTPRIFAAAVTDGLSGSRHALWTMRPGCAGVRLQIQEPLGELRSPSRRKSRPQGKNAALQKLYAC